MHRSHHPGAAEHVKMYRSSHPGAAEHMKIQTFCDSSAKKLESICDTFLKLPDAPDTISTILSIIPLQFLAYHVAYKRGESIDQPRNLAKSVTVE